MNVRRFYLRNGRDEVFDFMSLDHFLIDPEGLGLSVSLSTLRIGNSELLFDKKYELQTFSGEICFTGDTNAYMYQNYRAFMRFLTTDYMRLCYQPVGTSNPLYCRAEVSVLQKTEIGHDDSILRVPIEIKCLEFWKKTPINSVVVDPTELDGKNYSQTGPGLYRPYYYHANAFKFIKITNNGDLITPLDIIVSGDSADNFLYSLYEYTGNDEEGYENSDDYTLYGRGRILGTYKYIEIDSDDLTENIILKTASSTLSNTYNMQDLSVGKPNEIYVTFLKMKPGRNAMSFSVPSDFTGTIEIRFWERYFSV